MNEKKILFVVILILFCVAFNTTTASVLVLQKNTDDINNVVMKFMLVDNTNRVMPALNINSAGIKLFDNSSELTVNQFVSAQMPEDSSAVMLCFDLSISNRTDNIADFNFAKDALIKCVSYLDDNTKVALLSMANIACVENDWTTERNEIATSIANFTYNSLFVNLYKSITSESISGLGLLSNIEATNKSLLLVTQGIINSDETELLLAKFKQNNTRLNIIYVSEIVPANIQRLADETGGFCISKDMLENSSNYLPLLASMAKLSEGYTPYTIQTAGNLNCSGEHNFELTTTTFGSANFYSITDSKQFTTIFATPSYIEFPSIEPGTTITKTVTLVAQNAGINIAKITTTNPLFKIASISESLPAYLPQNTELTIDITFEPSDSSIAFAALQVLSDACTYDTLYLTGGYPNIAPNVPTINIVKPTCSEVLVIGDSVEVAWNGVLAKDVVSLNTQTDRNQHDTFALNVVGLSNKYYISPDLDADSLRFIVNQMWPNNVGKTLTFQHKAPVKFAFFNTLEDKIITATNDNIVSIWNANSGALIHQFTQFNKQVNWVKFFKNPELLDAEYIAVACADSSAYLFDASDYSLIWRHKANSENIFSIEASPDGKYAAIAVGNTAAKGNFDVVDLTTGELKNRTFIPVENCRYVTFHPTKKYEIMAISSWTGIIYFYELKEEDDNITVNYYDNLDARDGVLVINSNYATYNYDGSKILMLNPQTESVSLIDRNAKKILYSIRHSPVEYQRTPNFASFFYFKNDVQEQDYILTAGLDNMLKRWHVSDGSPSDAPSIFAEHTQSVNTGVFSTDGWRLLSASDDRTAKIWNLNQKVLQTDTSCMLRVATAKCELIDTIRFNDTEQNEMTIKTARQHFKNICDFGYNIYSIRVVGDNPLDFVMIDEFVSPLKIKGLGTLDFNIVFRPQAEGVRSAKLQFIIPNDTIYIELTGLGLAVGLQPLCELIDFGNMVRNDYKDTIVALAVNQSNRDIILSNIFLSGPQQNNFKIDILNENKVLKPKDTLHASVKFYSTSVGKKYSTLAMHNSHNNSLIKWNLTGNATEVIQDTIELTIQDFTAKTGDITPCPIYLYTKTNYQSLNIDQIEFTIKFNSTLLHPQIVTNEVTILSSKYDDTEATLTIAIDYKPGKQQINGLQFVTLWGNDTTTKIRIIDSKINSNQRVKVVTSDATFTVSDYCTAGDVRLFDAEGSFLLQQNSPNPVTNVTTIGYRILESGQASLDLFNFAGHHIKNIFNEYKPNGVYFIELETQNLVQGSYFYILQSGLNKDSKIMTIVK